MRFGLISVFCLLLLVAFFAVLAGRAITPILIGSEKQELLGAYPLVKSVLLYIPADTMPKEQIQKIKKLSGLDVTLIGDSGAIHETSLEGGSSSSGWLDVGARGETIFEMVSVAASPSFVLSGPLVSPSGD